MKVSTDYHSPLDNGPDLDIRDAYKTHQAKVVENMLNEITSIREVHKKYKQ